MQKGTKSNHVYPGQLEGKSIVEANTVSSYLKRSLCLLFLDHLTNELDEQLVKPLPGFQAQPLIPGMLCIYIYIIGRPQEKVTVREQNREMKPWA